MKIQFNKLTDLIQIIAPSFGIDDWSQIVTQAKDFFSAKYLTIKVSNNLISKGLYANDIKYRVQDFIDAALDENVKIIWPLRGGYGTADVCFELLNKQNWPDILQNLQKKIIIGYSDITALHCLSNKFGIISIHGNHIKEITQDSNKLDQILDSLVGTPQAFELTALNDAASSHSDRIQGILIGGNLTVLASVCGTELQPNFSDKIVILEDVNEPIQKINRCLTQLVNLQHGKLSECAAIILADFACQDQNFQDCITHIANLGTPVFQTTGFGHNDVNKPAIFGINYIIDQNLLYSDSEPLLVLIGGY